jgi:glycerate 2-kinase
VKQLAQRIFRDVLAAIDIPATIDGALARNGSLISVNHDTIDLSTDLTIDLNKFDKILAIAFGKAAFAMADGLVRVLAPDHHAEIILVVPAAPQRELPDCRIFVAGHPVPNEASVAAARAILARLAKCDERTLIFFLVSGGGSALVELPLDPSVTLADIQQLHVALVACGAPIEEINTVRKHLSAVKGGRLAAAAPHSAQITLAISDVPHGHESALASGPTLPDPTTIADAERMVAAYGLAEKLPPSLRAAFETHRLGETPKDGDAAFARSHFVLLLGAHELTHAAHHACEAHGYFCICDSATDDWPVEDAADYLLGQLEAQRRANPGRPCAVLAGGEVSSPVKGSGVGGRNSAFVLACVLRIAGKNITVLSAGTDGIDGNSPAAGAVADGATLARARAAGLDPGDFMQRSDAYSFFASLADAVITGPTGNNLRDLRILLAQPEPQ